VSEKFELESDCIQEMATDCVPLIKVTCLEQRSSESKFSDNQALHKSEQPQWKNTDCIPLMMAASQKNYEVDDFLDECALHESEWLHEKATDCVPLS